MYKVVLIEPLQRYLRGKATERLKKQLHVVQTSFSKPKHTHIYWLNTSSYFSHWEYAANGKESFLSRAQSDILWLISCNSTKPEKYMVMNKIRLVTGTAHIFCLGLGHHSTISTEDFMRESWKLVSSYYLWSKYNVLVDILSTTMYYKIFLTTCVCVNVRCVYERI